MSDIVERLRILAAVDNCQASIEAADTILRLTAENERLRAAMEKICNGPRDADLDYLNLFVEVKMEARAALEGKQ
jgi:hypothetical protein